MKVKAIIIAALVLAGVALVMLAPEGPKPGAPLAEGGAAPDIPLTTLVGGPWQLAGQTG